MLLNIKRVDKVSVNIFYSHKARDKQRKAKGKGIGEGGLRLSSADLGVMMNENIQRYEYEYI